MSRRPSEFTPNNGLWVRMLSEGGMTEPSAFWLSHFRKFEKYFEAFHPYGKFNREPGVVKRLSEILSNIYTDIPEKAIKLYSKTRTMIRIASINKEVESRKFELQERRRNSNLESEIEAGSAAEVGSDIETGLEVEDYDHEEVQDLMTDEDIDELLALLDI